MKIGINATCFNNRPSGAKQRFVGIYSILFKMMPNDDFIIYEPADCSIRDWFDDHDNVSYVATKLNSTQRYIKYVYGIFYWPQIYKSECFDIFESFNLPLTPGNRGLSLLTIHDIRGIHMSSSWLKWLLNNIVLRYSINKSDHIITVSNYMKNEIYNNFKCKKISVVYNSIDSMDTSDLSELETREIIRKFDLPDEYFLSVGHFEKRKNYITLIKVLTNLKTQNKKANLVIVGNDSGEKQNVIDMIESCGIKENVTILSGISHEELKAIYKMAKLFIFPSSYEGFGIPILEAMNAKVPVALSDIPVFREIAGESGYYFNCDDTVSMSSVISKINYNNIDSLLEKNMKIVQQFNFHNAASSLKKIYKGEVV